MSGGGGGGGGGGGTIEVRQEKKNGIIDSFQVVFRDFLALTNLCSICKYIIDPNLENRGAAEGYRKY
jgi:hypothetical protein